MHVFETIDEVRRHVAGIRQRGQTMGCVPTMGALHKGHLSLIEAALANDDRPLVTIFVNPTQFAPGEDFERYPRPLEQDLELCRQAGAEAVFRPEPAAMYPPHAQTTVTVNEITKLWEGQHRPSHFGGVTTIVLKLLNIVQPHRAYFGQKDYQQLAVIRTMCRDLNLNIEIVGCPTIREPDGLAMSSRNAYLTTEQRQQALAIHEALQLARNLVEAGETDATTINDRMKQHLHSKDIKEIDYAALANAHTLEPLQHTTQPIVALIAAHVGSTRLIDNLLLD